MSVEALDALVYTVLAVLWVLFAALFVGGAIVLRRSQKPERYQGRHWRPAPPPWWARVLDAYLASTRELAEARALLIGVPLP